MISKKQQKRRALQEKLLKLRSATNSTATDSTTIIVDASDYMEELMEKFEKLNLEIQTERTPCSSFTSDSSTMDQVAVETVDQGFRISVYSIKNYNGFLVSILDAFDNLGLDVLDATISCSESFSLQALLGSKNQDQCGHPLNDQVIIEALLDAMKVWNE